MMPCHRCKDSGRPGYIRSAGNRIYRPCTSCEGGVITEFEASFGEADREIARLENQVRDQKKRIAELEAELERYRAMERSHVIVTSDAQLPEITPELIADGLKSAVLVIDPLKTTGIAVDHHQQVPVATRETAENSAKKAELITPRWDHHGDAMTPPRERGGGEGREVTHVFVALADLFSNMGMLGDVEIRLTRHNFLALELHLIRENQQLTPEMRGRVKDRALRINAEVSIVVRPRP